MATCLDNAPVEQRATASWIDVAVAAQRTVKAVAAAPPRDAGPRDAVRWAVARDMVFAWVLTLPASAIMAMITAYILKAFGIG